MATGVSTIAQILVWSGAPPASRPFSMACTSSTELTLGTTTAAGPALAAAAMSSACHWVVRPLTRIATSLSRTRPTRGGAHPVAGLGLGVGGDGVLEIEDQGVGREALGLLEGALVGAGHVEDGAAGEDLAV